MGDEAVDGSKMGTKLIMFVAIIGLALAAFLVGKSLINTGVDNLETSSKSINDSRFADYNKKIVKGRAVKSAIDTFQNEEVIILIHTLSEGSQTIKDDGAATEKGSITQSGKSNILGRTLEGNEQTVTIGGGVNFDNKCHEISNRIKKFAKVKEFDNSPSKNIAYKPSKVKKSEVETYIQIPYDDRDEAKALGARFDGNTKCWYIPKGTDPTKFTKWKQLKEAPKAGSKKKHYIKVSFDEKDEVKALGARFDGEKKSWYFVGDENKDKFKKWLKK